MRWRPTFAEKREIVRWRRERAELEAAGYRMHETDWEIHRGSRWQDVIVDVKISRCGKYVWTKLGPPDARIMRTLGRTDGEPVAT